MLFPKFCIFLQDLLYFITHCGIIKITCIVCLFGYVLYGHKVQLRLHKNCAYTFYIAQFALHKREQPFFVPFDRTDKPTDIIIF